MPQGAGEHLDACQQGGQVAADRAPLGRRQVQCLGAQQADLVLEPGQD
jgi:hypothetical protein